MSWTVRAVLTAGLCAVFASAGCASRGDKGESTKQVQSGLFTSIPAVADTDVRIVLLTQNYATDTGLHVASVGAAGLTGLAQQRSLLRFDHTQLAQFNGTVTLKLRIAATSDWPAGGGPVSLYRVTKPWTEAGATWTCAIDSNPSNLLPDCSGATSWDMLGLLEAKPWNPTATASATVQNGQTGDLSFDVTSDMALFRSGTPNYGWILLKPNEGLGGSLIFASRETATPPTLSGNICTPAECDDGNPCTTDSCSAGACVHTSLPNGTSCSDGNACTQTDQCSSGTCVGSNPVTCSALDTCHTAGTCNPATGACSNPPAAAGVDCSNGDPCDGLEKCNGAGGCVAGPPFVDDGNPCTTDTCSPATGIAHAPVTPGTSCSDNNVCNGTEICDNAGSCLAGTPLPTDDSNPCTIDTCDPITGVAHTPAPTTTTCPGQGVCSGPGHCNGTGGCTPGDPITLTDDGNACTLEWCSPASGPRTLQCSTLNRSTVTRLGDSTAFLYEGPNAIQTGMAPGTIQYLRASVLRGRVRNRAGAPLQQVTIKVLDHPEYGQTVTQADGTFDMAVNGGEPFTVSYTLPGYLPAQRQSKPDWQDFGLLSDVVMIPLDAQVTSVDLGEGALDTQVARGSVVTDSDGTRQATLLFPPGVHAQIVMPNGSTTSASNLHIRATEFTVGATGKDAMPAELPPTSAYTYAVELSADEALSAGAAMVTFDAPVPLYLESFLNLPVGTSMPSGYYDFVKTAWVPEPNGRVIKILSIAGGIATIDANGDNNADTSAQLTAVGITAEEQTKLATLYPAGTKLWRAPVQHFSTHDLNLASAPPPPPIPISGGPAGGPDGGNGGGGGGGGGSGPLSKPCKRSGSIIECENQILGESLPIAGTPFALNYRSDRVPGFAKPLTIPLTGPSVNGSMTGVKLDIRVGGRQFLQDFFALTNQTTTFDWDRKDVFGRVVQGVQPITVRLGYEYLTGYQVPANVPAAFSWMSGVDGNGMPSVRGQKQVSWSEWKGVLGGWDGRPVGLGGWSIDPHHVYDPFDRTLYSGSGDRRNTRNLPELVETAAGTGTGGFGGDGGPASQSSLALPTSLAAAGDGSIYIADTDNNRVRRIAPNGTITTVVGAGSIGRPNLLRNGSNEKPITAIGSIPDWTAVFGTTWQSLERDLSCPTCPDAFDGTRYFYAGDGAGAELRQDVDVSQYATAIDAGTQPFEFEGFVTSFNQSPIDAARVIVEYRNAANTVVLSSFDSNEVRDFTMWTRVGDERVAPAGTRFIRVRLITTRYSGTSNDGYFDSLSLRAVGPSSDGVAAADVALNAPHGLAFGPDGSLFIADTFSNRILKVTPTGIVRVVAGNGTHGFSGDHGPATAAKLANPMGVTVAPDGTVYIADFNNHRVRKVTPGGVIGTVAGTGTAGFTDGIPATDALLHYPTGVAIWSDGSVLIADRSNHRIRRIGVNGKISTLVGLGSSGVGSFSGDGGPGYLANLNRPFGVATAADGTIYIADQNNNRIRRVDPAGTITTVAGGGTGADKVAAVNTSLALPLSAIVAPDRSLWIADTEHNKVRRVVSSLPGLAVGDQVFASENAGEVYVLDARGRHVRTVDSRTNAQLYQFGYDTGGRLTTITDVDNLVTTIAHDANGNPTSITAPFGQRTDLAVDANGFLSEIRNSNNEPTAFTSDASGLLRTMVDAKNQGHAFDYTPNGRLTSDTDPANATQVLARRTISGGFGVAITSGEGRTTDHTVSTSSAGVEQRTLKSPNGATTTTSVSREATFTTTYADGTTTSTHEEADPRFGMQSPVQSVTTTTPGGLVSYRSESHAVTLSNPSDPLSLATETITVSTNPGACGSGANCAGMLVSSETYNAATRTFTSVSPSGRTSSRTVDAKGRTISASVPGILPVDFSYDAAGHLFQLAQGTHISTIGYSGATGWPTSFTDSLNRTTAIGARDGMGRVLSTTLPGERQLLSGYDANGNATSVTPPGKPSHGFGYTAADLESGYVPPAIAGVDAVMQSFWNRDRQMTELRRAEGSVLRGYDTFGRLTSLADPYDTVTYGYDSANRRTSASSASTMGASLTFTFDGSLPRLTTWTGGVAGTVERRYDHLQRMNQLLVNGTSIAFGYDADSLLTQAGSTAYLRNAQNGLLASATTGNVTETWSYDSFGVASAYEVKYAGSVIFSQAYGRDAGNRITSIDEVAQGTPLTSTFGYDLGGRLDTYTRGSTAVTYGYDANGNRTHVNGTPVATYDVQDRILTYGGTAFEHSSGGDLYRKVDAVGTTAYQYDLRGSLRRVDLPNGDIIEYLVDAHGRRVGRKKNGTVERRWLYDGQLRIVGEQDGAGSLVSVFVYGAAKRNVPELMLRGGAVYRLISDQVGTVRLVVNISTGTVAQALSFDARGVLISDSNPGWQPFGFAGGLWDPTTNLVRFGARDYDPSLARWTTKDSSRFGGGENLYAYVGNDPINLVDPTGKLAIGAGAAVGAGAAGVVYLGSPLGVGLALGAGALWLAYRDSDPSGPSGGTGPGGSGGGLPAGGYSGTGPSGGSGGGLGGGSGGGAGTPPGGGNFPECSDRNRGDQLLIDCCEQACDSRFDTLKDVSGASQDGYRRPGIPCDSTEYKKNCVQRCQAEHG